MTSPPPTCSTPLTISSTIFYTHYHPPLYTNDYIYSKCFPSSVFAGTVLRPGFAGPLLHAPSSYFQIVSTSTICRRLALIPAPSSYPERQFPRDTISSVQSVPLAWNRTQTPARAQLRAADRFANRIFPVQLLERQTTGAWQSFSPSRPSPSWVPAGPLLQHLSTLSYRPVDLPERRLRTPGHHFLRSIRSAGLEPNGPCRRSATAPSIPTTSIHRTSSTSAIFS